jgi:putative polymerase
MTVAFNDDCESASAPKIDYAVRAAAGLVFGALIFNFVLCFVNRNIFGISQALVMGSEMGLLGAALLLVAKNNTPLYVILAGYLSFALFLSSLQGVVDMKAIRDILIPIIFVFLGRRFGSPKAGDRLVSLCLWTVLIFGACEFLFLPYYVKVFDIEAYYIARGTIEAAAADTTGTGLFASGIRPEGRSLFPFLGPHRASSIFLEPVSVGNFGAIVFSWTVLRNLDHFKTMAIKLLPAIAVFILADARFGLMVSLTSFAIYPLAKHVGRLPLLFAPFCALFLLATIGFLNPDAPWDNGIGGRILVAGQMLSTLDFWEVMAFVPVTRFVSDSGYTYTLAKFGLLGCVGLWSLFVLRPVENEDAWRYRLFTGVYIIALLVISNSMYSIKTGALLWYLLGSLESPAATARDYRDLES